MAYAIPTKDANMRTRPLDAIAKSVEAFLAYAKAHPELSFRVTRVGCGLAGYSDADMAPLFRDAPGNCKLPPTWRGILSGKT